MSGTWWEALLSAPDASPYILGRLAVALLLGSLIGIGRELRRKSAGLRTHALMALSAASLTIVGLLMIEGTPDPAQADPGRILQALAQALGFLAAGAVIAGRATPHGLTTAVNLWLAGVVGIASGAGFYVLATLTTIATLIMLEVLPLVQGRTPREENIHLPPSDRS